MKLTFNAKTGHVKRDGAMIGRVALGDDQVWAWIPASFQAPGRLMLDPDRDHLLARIKAELTKPRRTGIK